METVLKTLPFLSDLLDAIPSCIFVFDKDVRVVYSNDAAAEFTGKESRSVFQKLCGEALQCTNSQTPGLECGQTMFCSECVLRNCIEKAFAGDKCWRMKTGLNISGKGFTKDIELRVSTFPLNHNGQSYVLAVIDNMSEINELRAIVPICAWCKRIRDDEQYWHRVDDYLKNHMDIQLTHGICPDCVKKVKEENP